MNRNQRVSKRLVLSVLTGFFAFGMLMVSPRYPDVSLGQRIIFAGNIAQHHVARWKGENPPERPPLPSEAEDVDDRGLSYLAALHYYFTPADMNYPAGLRVPPPIPWMLHLFFVFFVAWFVFEATPLFGLGAATLTSVLMVLSQPVRYVAFGADVYLFPFFSFVCLLGLWNRIFYTSELDEQRLGYRLYLKPALLCYLLVFFETVRTGGMLLGFSLLAIVCFPKLGTRIAALVPSYTIRVRSFSIFCIFLGFLSYNKYHSLGSHAAWHSLHAGLMEFGGHVGPRHEIYPWFVPSEKIPETSSYKPTWNDHIEYGFVTKNHERIRVQTREYSNVLKDDFFKLFSEYPIGFIQHGLRRIWNLLSVDIWSWTFGEDSKPGITFVSNTIRWGALFLLLLFAAFYPGRRLLLFSAFLPLALPTLLVYSSNFSYNLPAQVLLILISIFVLFDKTRISKIF